MTADRCIKATQIWLKNVIIDLQICPFAKRESDRGSIYYGIDTDKKLEQSLSNLILECERLDETPEIETTLLIYVNAFANFDDFLDLLNIAEALLVDQGYEGTYQLASFHPDYCFEGSMQDDPANYTNRSPYPMIHILRESSIERALTHYPDPENIPQRNIELTRKLGLQRMRTLLAACY